MGGAVCFRDARAVRRKDSVALPDAPVRFLISASVGMKAAVGSGGGGGGGGQSALRELTRCRAS